MTNFAQLQVRALYSEASDYSNPKIDSIDPYISTPTYGSSFEVKVLSASDVTIDLAPVSTTIDYIIVKNLDATNFVTVTWDSAANGATDNKIRVAAGKIAVISDVTVASDLILRADTANLTAQVVIVAAT